MKTCIQVLFLFLVLGQAKSVAQGPPILGEKPIMLGADAWLFKSLTEIRNYKDGTLVQVPIMVHYLPTANTLIGIHLPFQIQEFEGANTQGVGFIKAQFKYQFYTKNKKGSTFRLLAKSLQQIPMNKKETWIDPAQNHYQHTLAFVAGYESIRYGFSNALSYTFSEEKMAKAWEVKSSFGLPLLAPSYPVKQINWYTEFSARHFDQEGDTMLLLAQGLQYAYKSWVWEASFQVPLYQDIPDRLERKNSIFLGIRYAL